jgi:hypothetical protein
LIVVQFPRKQQTDSDAQRNAGPGDKYDFSDREFAFYHFCSHLVLRTMLLTDAQSRWMRRA